MIANNVKINADDFGLNSSVNKAIIEAFGNNYINSTTLMANMPGFDEAVYLTHKHKLNFKIGAHLVLTEGIPLTEGIKTLDFLFESKPKVKKQLMGNLLLLNTHQKKVIFDEFCAQIEKIKESGITVTHIDTHHHAHEFYPVLQILFQVRKIYKIPTIRILNNLIGPTSINKKIYRNTINYYLKRKQANHSDWFGNQQDFLRKYQIDPYLLEKRSIEIMVHPNYDHDGKLVDRAARENLNFNFVKICSKID